MSNDAYYDDSIDPELADGFHPVDEDDEIFDEEDEIIPKKKIELDDLEEDIDTDLIDEEELEEFLHDEDY